MDMNNTLLEQIATDVLNGMLGLDVSPTRDEPAHPDNLVASIRISGDWQAGLEVFTPVSSARRIAEQMFGTDTSELQDAEIADALGEIANMIGGNLKGMTPGETKLSLPCVGVAIAESGSPEEPQPTELHLRFGVEHLSLRLRQDVTAADEIGCIAN